MIHMDHPTSTPQPAGIGALTEDRNGALWLRGIDGDWIDQNLTEEWTWGELDSRVGPLAVLSHGVHPDGTHVVGGAL